MRLFSRGFIPVYHEFVCGDDTWKQLSKADRERTSDGKTWYHLDQGFTWADKKTGKKITVPAGFVSDGASGAIDIRSKAWWVHDWICERNGFNDGSECSNWDASRILSNILWSEKRFFRSSYWRWSTFFLGGKDLKKF